MKTKGRKKTSKAQQKPAYSPKELADRWGVHYRTVLERIDNGEIPSFSVGRQIRIPGKWVELQEGKVKA